MDYKPVKSDRVRALRRKLGKPEWGGKHITYNPPWRDGFGRGCRTVENASRGLRITAELPRYEYREWRAAGWYVDNFQSDTTEQRAVQLPARGGTPQWFPACTDPGNNDCLIVDFANPESTLKDAWYSGGQLAERYAEACRGDDAKQNAEQETEQLRAEIAASRAKHTAFVREIRQARAAGIPAGENVCSALRGALVRLRGDVAAARKRIAALADNYWLAVE